MISIVFNFGHIFYKHTFGAYMPQTNIKSLISFVKSSTLAKGTLLLTVTGLFTKVLGFYNRIFLTRLIGVSELGIYQLAFPVFILGFSICCQGLSTALTRHTAFHLANGHKKRAVNMLIFCCMFSLCLGILTSFFIRISADTIAAYVLKNSSCAVILRQLALALPAMCIKGCINGFFLGCGKTGLHGMSHLYEQLARIIAAYILACIICDGGYMAALASVSVVIGEYIATVIAVFFCAAYIKSQTVKGKSDTSRKSSGTILTDIKNLTKDYLPITANDILSTLFSSFEAVILPAMLIKFYADNDLVMEIYGAISCVVIPFLLFPATITTALSSVLLPSISKAASSGDRLRIRSLFQCTTLICTGLGVVSALFYSMAGTYICERIFESTVSGILLKKMCIACPLIYLSGSMHTILIGLGDAGRNLLSYIISIGLRIFVTMTFVPKFGVDAYIIGMLASYALELVMLMTRMKILLKPDIPCYTK
jgi:stage V sporulation protein B